MTSSFTLINGQLHLIKRNRVVEASFSLQFSLSYIYLHVQSALIEFTLVSITTYKETDLTSVFHFNCTNVIFFHCILCCWNICSNALFDETLYASCSQLKIKWIFSAKCTKTVVFLSFFLERQVFMRITKVSSFIQWVQLFSSIFQNVLEGLLLFFSFTINKNSLQNNFMVLFCSKIIY